jgi:predicted  nucleic acid-binding Zn-ribbon protein
MPALRAMANKHTPIWRLVTSVLLLGLAAWIFLNRVYVVDQLTVWRFKPSADIESVAEQSSMSDRGKFLFYASIPAIESRDTFNTHCTTAAEKTAILGCYAARKIYIYDVTDSRLTGVKEVTAVHEMLHAAYDRLSDVERTRVNGLIDQATQSGTNESIAKRLALYAKTEPGERYNELHSILGSEIKDLPADLEKYYGQYFVNRLTVVSLSERYEAVFNELETHQNTLVRELNALADLINKDSDSYNQKFTSLQSAILAFNQRAARGDFSSQSAFNAERSRLLAQQSDLNDLRARIENNIASYDAKKTELDALNLTAEGLQRSIDSNALPKVPSI